MAQNRILLLAGDYVEDYEVMVPLPGLADGRTPLTRRVSPRKEKPASLCALPSTTSKATRPTAKNADTTSCSTQLFEEVKAETYDALVIPGAVRRNISA